MADITFTGYPNSTEFYNNFVSAYKPNCFTGPDYAGDRYEAIFNSFNATNATEAEYKTQLSSMANLLDAYGQNVINVAPKYFGSGCNNTFVYMPNPLLECSGFNATTSQFTANSNVIAKAESNKDVVNIFFKDIDITAVASYVQCTANSTNTNNQLYLANLNATSTAPLQWVSAGNSTADVYCTAANQTAYGVYASDIMGSGYLVVADLSWQGQLSSNNKTTCYNAYITGVYDSTDVAASDAAVVDAFSLLNLLMIDELRDVALGEYGSYYHEAS